MPEEIINLPYDDVPGSEREPVIIHDYTANGAFRGRSILHTNAISLVINGRKTMRFAEQTVNVSGDTFHFLSAGNCIAAVDFDGIEPFRSILIYFDNATLRAFYTKYHNLANNKNSIQAEPYLSFDKDSFIDNYVSSLQILLHTGIPLSKEMKLLKFEELMLHLLHTQPEKTRSFRPEKPQNVSDMAIRKAVEANVTTNITIDELAFLCNMSPSTFKRKFTTIYNTSPVKWILQQRMQIAKDLLQHYQEKPADIYHKLGYENHSSFSQAFKQTFGLSPKDFQQQCLSV